MPNAAGEVIINRPVAEVFKYTASAHNGPAFIPNLNENTDIKPAEPSIDQTFNWRFNMAGVDMRGKASGLAYDVNKRVTLKLEGDVEAVWDYQFTAIDDDSTRLYTEVNYDVQASRLKQMVNTTVLDRFNQRTLDEMLVNLKLILESDDGGR
jgi:uncharacterized membrane protein